ncbi:MAG: hypothetical protein WAL12_21010 [Trebonia sp.]
MFTKAMFEPESLNKGTPGQYAGNQAAMDGDPLRGVQRGMGGVFPDPASQQAHPMFATVNHPEANPLALRSATGTAPGEVSEVVAPAITKAGNGGRTPQDALGYHPGAGTTSGSATPLAANRHATRPGAGRHPATGQFTEGQGVAAGHADLDQQPHGGDRFPRHAGPFGSQMPDPMTRPTPDVRPGSTLAHCLPDNVNVNRLDLRTPAGLPGGLDAIPDPTPVSRPQMSQTAMQNPRAEVTPGDIPSMVQTHYGTNAASRAMTAFGVSMGDVSEGFRG